MSSSFSKEEEEENQTLKGWKTSASIIDSLFLSVHSHPSFEPHAKMADDFSQAISLSLFISFYSLGFLFFFVWWAVCNRWHLRLFLFFLARDPIRNVREMNVLEKNKIWFFLLWLKLACGGPPGWTVIAVAGPLYLTSFDK